MKAAIAKTLLPLIIATGAAEPVIVSRSSGQSSSTLTHQSNVNKGGEPRSSCIFDFERGETPNCLRRTPTGELSIAPELVKELRFDSYGLAPVLSPSEGWMYVGRGGKVLIRGVPSMDNGADSFHDGLVRIVRREKYGFANRKGELVIPPVYDGALSFDNGLAKVCKGCASKCEKKDCEHRFFAGGEWFQVDNKGIVVAPIQLNK